MNECVKWRMLILKTWLAIDQLRSLTGKNRVNTKIYNSFKIFGNSEASGC
jgi:hypothetical protein